MNHELEKTLTLALVNYIDENRPEGTMDCSSGECVSLEKAFTEENFDSVETLINKKLSRLTEFEQEVSDIVEYCKEHGENVAFDYAKRHAQTLLAIAMKDLEKTFECNPDKLPGWLKDRIDGFKLEAFTRGYNKGYKEAEKQYNESVAYHFPIMPTPPSGWGCDGTHCTNPHHDCINCPFMYSSGGTITTPDTAYGTSTATLHGNTSATDGKEHNPSFTD